MQHEIARLQHVIFHVALLSCVVSECVRGEGGGVRGPEGHRFVRCSTKEMGQMKEEQNTTV